MSSKLKAIFINGRTQEVSEIEIDYHFTPIEKIRWFLKCAMIEQVSLGSNHVMLLDEDGKIRPDKKDFGFRFLGMEDAFIGHAMIVTQNGSQWADHQTLPQAVEELIEFVEINFKEEKQNG
jgi:hypothetical protein